MTSPLFRRKCMHCHEEVLCDAGEMVMHLRSLGHMRRGGPDVEMIQALLPQVSHQMRCSRCGEQGMSVTTADWRDLAAWRRPESRDESTDSDELTWDDPTSDDWPAEVRSCEQCRQPIPAERLEVFPKTRRCAACQSKHDQAGDEPLYCPRCGDLMQTAVARGDGITRYRETCRGCGHKQ